MVFTFIKQWLLHLFYSTLDHIPPFFWEVLNVLADIYFFWFYKLLNYLRPRSRAIYHEAIKELDQCETYELWCHNASMVDEITGANLWRRNFFSRRYDFNSVLEQFTIVNKALENNDIDLLREKFSTTGPCMLRNFAGIVDKRLFTKSLLGTKLLIEQYLEKNLEGLQLLNDEHIPTSFFQRCKLSSGVNAKYYKWQFNGCMRSYFFWLFIE